MSINFRLTEVEAADQLEKKETKIFLGPAML